jgi:hypothetical protein
MDAASSESSLWGRQQTAAYYAPAVLKTVYGIPRFRRRAAQPGGVGVDPVPCPRVCKGVGETSWIRDPT